MTRRYDQDGQPIRLSNRDMLKFLVDEIPAVRKELKEDIARLDQKIDRVASELNTMKTDLTEVKSNLNTLNIKSDQNHICLMTNQDGMEKRIEVLEAA